MLRHSEINQALKEHFGKTSFVVRGRRAKSSTEYGEIEFYIQTRHLTMVSASVLFHLHPELLGLSENNICYVSLSRQLYISYPDRPALWGEPADSVTLSNLLARLIPPRLLLPATGIDSIKEICEQGQSNGWNLFGMPNEVLGILGLSEAEKTRHPDVAGEIKVVGVMVLPNIDGD